MAHAPNNAKRIATGTATSLAVFLYIAPLIALVQHGGEQKIEAGQRGQN